MFNITCSLQYKITNVSFKAGATACSEKYTVKNWQNLKAFSSQCKSSLEMWKYELKQERRIQLWQKWQRKSFLQKSWTIRADAFIALLLPCSIFVVVRFLFVGTRVVFEDPKKKIGTIPDNCYGHHGRCPCKNILSGVKFSRLNAKTAYNILFQGHL